MRKEPLRITDYSLRISPGIFTRFLLSWLTNKTHLLYYRQVCDPHHPGPLTLFTLEAAVTRTNFSVIGASGLKHSACLEGEIVMKKAYLVATVVAIALLLSAAAMAAPSLPITKPPVVSGPNPYTGPTNDPTAVQGQWFRDAITEESTYRPYEFYDNRVLYGGGSSSTDAIYGKVTDIALNGSLITSFVVQATIRNDTATAKGTWFDGANSHWETLRAPETYAGPLLDTKLTTSFAISSTANVPSQWTPPYTEIQPYIIAEDYDELAWYCWSPGEGDPEGGYYVPTFDFGDIPLGASVTKYLHFTVGELGLDPVDPRYAAVYESYWADEGAGDIFSNRTTSLKISDWVDTLALDDGTPYPGSPMASSDVSVFHAVPEPSSLLAMFSGLAGLGVLIRRRR
jgi:hypothetical protein